jgi:hypothetical protein
MNVSGLVVTLDDNADRAAEAVREVLLAGPFTLGDVFGHRVAIALEAETPTDAERWHRWVADLPGVLKVDVAFVHLEPAAEEAAHDR